MKDNLTEIVYRLEACKSLLESLQSEVSGFMPRISNVYHTDAAIYGIIALLHDTMFLLWNIIERMDDISR